MSHNKTINKIKIHTCRICLDANSVDMVLIDEQNGWLPLFEFCFGVTLTTRDEPRLLCKLCAENIQNYVKFKEKCLKSHRLWTSVISDVQCHIVKRQDVENTHDRANNNATGSGTIIKDTIFDPLSDIDIHYSDDNDNEMDNFSSADIKSETCENDIVLKDEEIKIMIEDCIVKKEVTESKRNEEVNSYGIVRSKNKTIHTCEKCNIIYDKKYLYKRHIKLCHSQKKKRIFPQNYAYDLGKKKDSLNIANVKHDPQSKLVIGENENVSFFCGLCNLSFTTSKDLYIHLNDHWSNNDCSCKICDFVGSDLAATIVHRYSHLPHDTTRFFCHMCEKYKRSLLGLHFHYRKDHLKKSTGGYCSICNKEYDKLRRWKMHELTHRPPNFICDYCGKGFYYKYMIEDHVTVHMGQKKNICDICGKTFNRRRNMELHKNTVHSKLGPLKCTHCNRMFKNKVSLNCHIKSVTREKTLKCEVCSKTFITPNVMKLHMVHHCDKRPYGCDVCGCSYKYKSQLKIHLLKHYGLQPQCSICMKTFASPMSLKRHSSVHTGQRPYRCTIPNCMRDFYSNKLLQAHLASHHKNDYVAEK